MTAEGMSLRRRDGGNGGKEGTLRRMRRGEARKGREAEGEERGGSSVPWHALAAAAAAELPDASMGKKTWMSRS